ncbi:MAG: polyprenol monophosphomannose synthase [SAR202 cluster bacterium]|nr:polyprenol monophosphomannose synthase [SAR202 cluster bacterium]|tara:strand:+ start:15255 stop:16043 length:789 start_codon:yes stop_codon:yes gene_type:complete
MNHQKLDKITAVIPTYNEADNLPSVIRQLFALKIPYLTVIVVDDNSPDNTAKVAKNLREEFHKNIEIIVRPQKSGLGTAYKEGFKHALDNGAEFLIQLDADLSHPISEIPAMLEKLKEADIIIGSRYSSKLFDSNKQSNWPLHRRLLSSIGNLAIRLVSGIEVHDATSGFKAIRGTVIRNIKLEEFTCRGFGFQAEMAFKCQHKGYKTIEHPIHFVNRTKGQSKMSAFIIAESIWVLLCLRISQIKKSIFLNKNLRNHKFYD